MLTVKLTPAIKKNWLFLKLDDWLHIKFEIICVK